MLPELEIVNSMLATRGIAGLTANNINHPDYAVCASKINLVRTSTLKLGMWFNTSMRTLTATVNNEIVLSGDTLHVDAVDTSKRYAKRGLRLFDLDKRTFTFKSGTDIKVKFVQDLSLDLLPYAAAEYIMHKSRYDYYLDEDGTEPKLSNYEKDKQLAWAHLYREHLKNRDINSLNSYASLRYRRGNARRAGSLSFRADHPTL